MTTHAGSVRPELRTVATTDYPLRLRSGVHLDEVVLEVESWGRPNADRSNAILVCHSFSHDAHAAGVDITATGFHRPWRKGRPGWWDALIGPGRALDTDKYWVIASAVLGGAGGSTGPASLNPHVRQPWGAGFPRVHVTDMVAAQKRLMAQLGLTRWRLVVGGSLGGIQALAWALESGAQVDDVVAIAAGKCLSPRGRAHFQHWSERLVSAAHGDGDPAEVLRAAFADSRHFSGGPILPVSEADLVDEWPSARFSPAAYLTLARALLDFDVAQDWGAGSLSRAAEHVGTRLHLLGYRGDGVFSPTGQERLATAVRSAGGWARSVVVPSRGGHDSFLTQPQGLEPWLREILAAPRLAGVTPLRSCA